MITTLIWSTWYLPIALLYKNYSNPLLGVIAYMLSLFLISMVLTLLREYGGSVIPVAIMHGFFNGYYFIDGVNMSWELVHIKLSKMILLFLLLLMLVIIFRRNRMFS